MTAHNFENRPTLRVYAWITTDAGLRKLIDKGASPVLNTDTEMAMRIHNDFAYLDRIGLSVLEPMFSDIGNLDEVNWHEVAQALRADWMEK